jgi:hypothetical protein
MKKVLLFICISFVAMQAQAQFGRKTMGHAKDRIQTAHIAFISNRLNLDEATAKTFWPVYQVYADALKALNQEKKQYSEVMHNETASDADLDKAMNNFLAVTGRINDLQKKYKVEFLKVINIRQLAKLYASEKDFKELLLKRMGKSLEDK